MCLIDCLLQKESFVCPLLHPDEPESPNHSNHCLTECVFSPLHHFLSSREKKRPHGISLSSSHTRDLSRLTATYFSYGHFSNASPAKRLNTRPTSQSTGAFWKTAFHPSLAAWWLWKFTLTFKIFTFWAFSWCFFSPRWLSSQYPPNLHKNKPEGCKTFLQPQSDQIRHFDMIFKEQLDCKQRTWFTTDSVIWRWKRLWTWQRCCDWRTFLIICSRIWEFNLLCGGPKGHVR